MYLQFYLWMVFMSFECELFKVDPMELHEAIDTEALKDDIMMINLSKMDSHMEKIVTEIYIPDNVNGNTQPKIEHSSSSSVNPKFSSTLSQTIVDSTDEDDEMHSDIESEESAHPEASAEPESNLDFDETLKTFEDLVKTASSLSHTSDSVHEQVKRAVDDFQGIPDEHLLLHVEEAYSMTSKASVAVEEDNYRAFKLLMKAKSILKLLVSQIKSKDITKIVSKVKAGSKKKHKRSAPEHGEKYKPKMVSRGFNSQEYNWLANVFDLSKQEVDEVKNLSDEEFMLFSKRLQEESDITDSDYSVDDLIQVFKSARQLVPAELEAAALGIVHVGRHLGGRARVAVDPVVSLVRDTVIPGTGRLVDQAVETVPDDVRDWVGQGGKIASKRVDAVVGYLGPRLSSLSHTINDVQDTLTETAIDTYDQVAPRVIPALKSVISELQDALDYTRDALPPVGDHYQSIYSSVKDTVNDQVLPAVEPITTRLGKTLKDDVGPTLKDAVKTSLNAVFTGVPKVITQLSHEAHDAAKVFTGNYREVLRNIKSQQKESNKDFNKDL